MLMEGSVASISTGPKHSRAAKKYGKTARFFVLEVVDKTIPNFKVNLANLERFWILYFWKHQGAKHTLNTELIPESRKTSPEVRSKMSKLHRQRFVEDPKLRKFMSDKVRAQWTDPSFVEANQRRRRALAESGFAPKTNLVTVRLPSGLSYVVRQKYLTALFGLGGRIGGPTAFFRKSKMFSDWKVHQSSVQWRVLRDMLSALDDAEGAMSRDPLIVACLKVRDLVGAKWSASSPIKFESIEGVFKTPLTTKFQKGGKILHDGGHLIKRYGTMYEFLKDRVPTFW